MRKITHLVVHCTASPDYMDVGFQEINQWHKDRGFLSPSGVHCGYHYIIRRDGTIEKGRPDEEVGAHAKGVNSKSLGIVWAGTNEITPKQHTSLIALLQNLKDQYSINIDNVLGHREAVETDKTCPNLAMDKIRASVLFTQPKVKVSRT